MSSCIEFTGWKKPTGYGQVRLDGTNMHAHRAEWIKNRGPIPDGMVVMHTCDNPSCINLDHLKLGTQKENMRDCVQKGRFNPARGSSHYLAKLAETDIPFIRSLPWRQIDIASAYGISQSLVSIIKLKKKWRHV